MHGGEDSPRPRYAGRPLYAAHKEGELQFFLTLMALPYDHAPGLKLVGKQSRYPLFHFQTNYP